MDVQSNAAYLKIKSATKDDSGSYICKVYNPVSDTSGQTEMNIEVTGEKCNKCDLVQLTDLQYMRPQYNKR